MKKLYFKTFDGKMIPYLSFKHEEEITRKNIVIIHGACEHIMRYEEFSNFLYQKGYNVFVLELRGHGELRESVVSDVSKNGIADIVFDIKEFLRETFKNQKYDDVILFGHGFGGTLVSYISIKKPYKNIILSGMPIEKALTIDFNLLVAKTEIKTNKLESKLNKNRLVYDKAFKNEGSFSFLTRDKEEVKKFNEDPDCGFLLSPSFYKGILTLMKFVKKNIKKINKNANILFIFGSKDPIVSETKVKKYMQIINDGYRRIKLLKNDNGRHDSLHEINKEKVYNEILTWIQKIK